MKTRPLLKNILMTPTISLSRHGRHWLAAVLIRGSLILGLAQVQAASETWTFNPLAAIPDGTTAGLASPQTIASSLGNLTDVNVSLDLSGIAGPGFNGDLYITLVHASGFSVLLNRVGRSTTTPFGYGDSGLAITLDDQAGDNVHGYRAALPGGESTALMGSLTGAWKPDGRTTDPFSALITDPPALGANLGSLGSFNGTIGSGEWVLFVADIERGATMQLNHWSLTLVGTPIPEAPASVALIGIAVAVGVIAWQRSRRS